MSDASRILVAMLGICACGDDAATSDGSANVDARAEGLDACPTSECRVQRDYGELESSAGVATRIHPTNHSNWQTNIDDECGSEAVHLAVELIAGRGALPDSIAPGTYQLEEEDFDIDTCGVCVRMIADFESADARCYFATAGRLVLDEVDERFEGQLEEATFGPIDCEIFTRIETDCSSQIGVLPFDSEYFFSD